MSYNKIFEGHVIRFKDERSYLEAKLEHCKYYRTISFLYFIQQEMYSKNTCEVEGMGISFDGTYANNSGVNVYENLQAIISDEVLNFNHNIPITSDFMSNSNYSMNYESLKIQQNNIITDVEKKLEVKDNEIDSRFDILDL